MNGWIFLQTIYIYIHFTRRLIHWCSTGALPWSCFFTHLDLGPGCRTGWFVLSAKAINSFRPFCGRWRMAVKPFAMPCSKIFWRFEQTVPGITTVQRILMTHVPSSVNMLGSFDSTTAWVARVFSCMKCINYATSVYVSTRLILSHWFCNAYFFQDLFQRHPDVVKRLTDRTTDLLRTLLDGLVWRSYRI